MTMNKSELNQQIVLCRKRVKKAKVCVVRKLIKQIKILRTCKNEQLREKKFRKARRLAAEIHVMRTLRPDYVTKFALITEDYVSTGSNTKLKRKRNACAKLAKHKDLVKAVQQIRDRFTNWREELPPLLETKKKVKEDDDDDNDKTVCDNESTINKSDIINSNEEAEDVDEDTGPSDEDEEDQSVTGGSESEVEDVSEEEEEMEVDREVLKNKKSRIKNGNVNKKCGDVKPKIESNLGKKKKRKKEELVFEEEEEESGDESDVGKAKEEKIDDPFFIGKKIRVPKLMQEDNEDHPENEKRSRKMSLDDDVKEDKVKRDKAESRKKTNEKFAPGRGSRQPPTEDELHPSWRAKKAQQIIKPFEGKKIKFDD